MAGNRATQPQRHVAVVFVHGILASNDSFAEPMEKRLRKRLADIADYVHYGSVYWADKLRDNQKDYLGRARGMKHKLLRNIVVRGLGDAAAYQKTSKQEDSIYYEIQAEIYEKIRTLDQQNRAQNRGDCPLIFIGHSLGAHIISSFVWDANKLKQRPSTHIATHPNRKVVAMWTDLTDPKASAFRRLDTFAGFVTIGSNIPLFTFSFGGGGIYPVTMAPHGSDGTTFKPAFPGLALTAELAARSKWLNFYSSRDVLGYPLKALNDFFRDDERIVDISVRSEKLWSRILPYWSCYSAHVGYWTNDTVLTKTADLIRDMVVTHSDTAVPAPLAPQASTTGLAAEGHSLS